MKLCTFSSLTHETESRVGAIVDEHWLVDLASAPTREKTDSEYAARALRGMITFLSAEREALGFAERAVATARESLGRGERIAYVRRLENIRFLAPIPRPSKIVATLVNTRGMLGGDDIEMKHPRLFMKAPSTVIGPNESILAPRHGIRPEVELAAIIGKEVRSANAREAEGAIFGYTIFNDVTAPRESKEDAYQAYRRDPNTGVVRKTTLRGPLFRSENHDTFGPMGPWIVTRDQIANIDRIRMTTRFDGELIQSGTTADYIFKSAEIIAFVSSFLGLEPGDVVSAGSIGWIAAKLGNVDPSEWVLPSQDGVVELEVEGIGILRNPVKPMQT